eukprot:jgi/Botrbrau1/17743/Bobra.0127s0008.1
MSDALNDRTICTGCLDHVDAARAGHLHWLDQLCKEGAFLPLNSPDWASAGEARKRQVFEAAIAGCSSSHAHVLAWLFPSEWPSIEAMCRWDTQDLWEQHRDFAAAFPALMTDFEPFCLEYKLYCCAVQQPTPSCLEALLDAGCRSRWICRIAAREGKADFLALAAKRGCPCDLDVWKFAASSGQHAVLEVLAFDHAICRDLKELFKKRGYFLEDLHDLAAANGQWECLQILERAGYLDMSLAAVPAACAGQLQILRNIVDQDQGVLQYSYLFDFAAQSGSLACLEFLEGAGCRWEGHKQPVLAAGSRSSEALRYCLQRSHEQLQERDWDDAMLQAVCSGSPDCMQALYDYGYQLRAAERYGYPARLAIRVNSLPCLHLALKLSGSPQLQSQDVQAAAKGGEEMLKFVHGLGGTLNSEVAECAASAGQVGALRYALEQGAPLSMGTFGAAMDRGSVECLKCAFEHGLTFGFPADYEQPPSNPFSQHAVVPPSFRMLRYVCEVMCPSWVQQLLSYAAGALVNTRWKAGKDGWKMCLYLSKQMEGPLPRPLDELVRVRGERARALAGVFYQAKKLSQAGPPCPSLALWGAMDRVPLELRERIAFQAHLICPVTQLRPL